MAARKHEDRATRPRAAATRFRCILVEPLYENKTLTTGTLKRRILGRKNFFFFPSNLLRTISSLYRRREC